MPPTLIRSFRGLNVQQAARVETQQVYAHRRSLPAAEGFPLTGPIRRLTCTAKAMKDEAWTPRRYPAVLINKIDEALDEANETQSWLDDCFDCGYTLADEFKQIDAAWQCPRRLFMWHPK